MKLEEIVTYFLGLKQKKFKINVVDLSIEANRSNKNSLKI